MKTSSITVVIAGNTYTLRVDDPKSLRDIPANDRDQLILVLEALKAQREKSERLAQDALTRNIGKRTAVSTAIDANQSTQPTGRLGKGDVDAIITRLIAEEKQQRKPGLKPATIYKLAAAIIVVIVLLSIF